MHDFYKIYPLKSNPNLCQVIPVQYIEVYGLHKKYLAVCEVKITEKIASSERNL